MDGKYFKPDSDFVPKKCSRRCNGGVDRISQLPDEIILIILSFLSLRESVTTSVLSSRWLDLWKHTLNLKFDRISQLPDEIIIFILSLLSLKEAVATSALSSRWSDLWKRTPNLNFNDRLLEANHDNPMPILLGNRRRMHGSSWDVERCKYIQMVNSVLKSHKTPLLKEFSLSLYVNKLAQCTVTKWLEFVFSRQVERLELDFLCVEHGYLLVLEELLRAQNLIGFKSIKRLCLKCVKVSGEAIDLFLRNCPLLEKMYIHDAVLTSDIVVCGTTLALKHFDINGCTGQYGKNGVSSIKVSAPNLTWLRIDTISQKFLLENMPKLIRAEYKCTSPSRGFAKHFASAVFSCISQLEILTLTLIYPKVFFAKDFPQMPKLKKLGVDYTGAPEHGLLPVTALIWAAPRLQEFELQFVRVPRCSTKWKEGINNVARNPHKHLKVFGFKYFSARASDHMELLTYIIDNCVALGKIIIGSSPFDKDRVKQRLHGKIPHHIQLRVVYAGTDRLL